MTSFSLEEHFQHMQLYFVFFLFFCFKALHAFKIDCTVPVSATFESF